MPAPFYKKGQRMKLVANKRLRYPSGPDGKEYNAGQEFTALSERDAKALTLVRAARYADQPAAKPTPPAPKPQQLHTAALKAEPMTTQESPLVDAPRRYRRRDLQSED